MTVLEFISAIVGSLAWPVLVLILVLILREPIVSLINAVKSFQYKDFRFDLDRKLNELAVDSAAIGPPETGVHLAFLGRVAGAPAMFDAPPRFQIIEAWLRIESALKALAKDADITWAVPESPVTIAKRLLAAARIDEATFKIIIELFEIRTSVVHASNDSAVTASQAIRYLNYAGILEWSLTNRRRRQ